MGSQSYELMTTYSATLVGQLIFATLLLFVRSKEFTKTRSGILFLGLN